MEEELRLRISKDLKTKLSVIAKKQGLTLSSYVRMQLIKLT